MEAYFVEGQYVNHKGLKKSKRSGRIDQADIEPFAQRFYANSSQEALKMAEETLQGGQWVEGPKVSRQTEEQHMRAIGAPQLPGFGKPPGKPGTTSRKK